MATLRTSRHLSLNAPLTPPRGATLAVATMVKILEHNAKTPQQPLPIPVALVLNYAALDFNFTSWMSAEHLKVLRSEQSSGNLPGLHELVAQKDHLKHVVRGLFRYTRVVSFLLSEPPQHGRR